jgi:GR25 family glycosyltransferase involved in LPS biosynthesis
MTKIPRMHVINLDRSVDRLARFHERSSHVPDILRVSATDGAQLNREDVVKSGLIAPSLSYSMGTIGSPISHISLWKKAADENVAVTIFEDDILISKWFQQKAEAILGQIGDQWDVIFWGYAFNPSYVWVEFGETRTKLECYGDRCYADETSLVRFRDQDVPVIPVRLMHVFGTLAYSVSPKGARAMLDYCLPLRNRLIEFPDAGVRTSDTSIDVALCGIYASLNAYICIPRLVIPLDGASVRLEIDQETVAGV